VHQTSFKIKPSAQPGDGVPHKRIRATKFFACKRFRAGFAKEIDVLEADRERKGALGALGARDRSGPVVPGHEGTEVAMKHP
jgi:hypothetical protein